jgi:hypothetical protein
MKQELMKALLILAQSTIDKARRKGFDILLLLGGLAFFSWQSLRTEAKMDAMAVKHENKIERINSEYAAALNATNRRLLDCERDKYDLSIRVAVLEYAQTKNKKR